MFPVVKYGTVTFILNYETTQEVVKIQVYELVQMKLQLPINWKVFWADVKEFTLADVIDDKATWVRSVNSKLMVTGCW